MFERERERGGEGGGGKRERGVRERERGDVHFCIIYHCVMDLNRGWMKVSSSKLHEEVSVL